MSAARGVTRLVPPLFVIVALLIGVPAPSSAAPQATQPDWEAGEQAFARAALGETLTLGAAGFPARSSAGPVKPVSAHWVAAAPQINAAAETRDGRAGWAGPVALRGQASLESQHVQLMKDELEQTLASQANLRFENDALRREIDHWREVASHVATREAWAEAVLQQAAIAPATPAELTSAPLAAIQASAVAKANTTAVGKATGSEGRFFIGHLAVPLQNYYGLFISLTVVSMMVFSTLCGCPVGGAANAEEKTKLLPGQEAGASDQFSRMLKSLGPGATRDHKAQSPS